MHRKLRLVCGIRKEGVVMFELWRDRKSVV